MPLEKLSYSHQSLTKVHQSMTIENIGMTSATLCWFEEIHLGPWENWQHQKYQEVNE